MTNWKRILVINTMVTALCFPMTGGLAEPTWSGVLETLMVSALYVNTIGTASALLRPRIIARVGNRSRPVQITIQTAAFFTVFVAGLAAVPALLLALGIIDASEYVDYAVPLDWPTYALAALVVLPVGISLYEGMLRDLEVKLRTKERDEAVARRLATEAQLASLESRVQPHFLFNALNSIAALIPDDPARAERMVSQVSSLLRSSLDGPSLVPLAEELKVVRDYLEVERARFGDRLRYEVEVGAGTEHVCVPRLSVQTLVENSVKYAVSPRRAGASLEVRASEVDGRLRLQVHDDGPGFSEAEVRDHHGLALLRARLAILFGDRAALTIDSNPSGTSVIMELPA